MSSKVTAALLGLTIALASVASGSSLPSEDFRFQWSLRGFKGFVARVLIPGRGEGKLTTEARGGEILATELLISSQQGRSGEYWLYGSEINASERRVLRSWSSQRFRGKSRKKERDATSSESPEASKALDLASSIYFLRREQPEAVQRAEIWSSGRVYPVEIRPGKKGLADWQGQQVATRLYQLRPLRVPGRKRWDGSLDVVISADDEGLPLEIVVERKGLKIRLELTSAEIR